MLWLCLANPRTDTHDDMPHIDGLVPCGEYSSVGVCTTELALPMLSSGSQSPCVVVGSSWFEDATKTVALGCEPAIEKLAAKSNSTTNNLTSMKNLNFSADASPKWGLLQYDRQYNYTQLQQQLQKQACFNDRRSLKECGF